jgi:mevalonate kinase
MEYYASGKLLLFGEYLVLKGSGALAIPLKYGQKLSVEKNGTNLFNWTSSIDGNTWFSASFSGDLHLINSSDEKTANKLSLVLKAIKQEKPELFLSGLNFDIDADFPLDWGFGSSSTLVSCLAQWSALNPNTLLQKTFGGSGYDIACATANTPILYEREMQQSVPVYLFPKVTSKLLFVYSGKKQDSESEVRKFTSVDISSEQTELMNKIILSATKSTQIEAFEDEIIKSEALLSEILNTPSIKEAKFSDYPYQVKSLGAWGGDFFLATFRKGDEAREYFRNKGFAVQFNYNEVIKQ